MTATAILGFDSAERAPDGLVRGFMQGASLHNLQQLVVMRNIAIVAQTLTVLVVYRGMAIDLPIGPMATVIVALALFNAATWYRLGLERPVIDRELMLQLLVDVSALSLLLAMAGGATNPFVGMFLLPLAITAASLPWAYTWLMALVTIACYSLLVLFFRPLFGLGEEARYMQLLVSGMWVNYAITAGMIAHFVVRISTGLRRGEQLVAATREREMCNEHLVRIGTLAAGAAHELAQPLSTMAVVVAEMQHRCKDQPDLQAMARDVELQLKNCRDTLSTLLSHGRHTFDTGFETEPLDVFVRRSLDAFRARRIGVHVAYRVDTAGPPPAIRHDLALRQGLLNLLGNAADVSPDWIEVTLSWDSEALRIAILDRGPGISPAAERNIGKIFFTTKQQGSGNGLGLCLAQTAVARLGGSLEIFNAPQRGACALIVLPLEAATAPAGEHRAAR